MTPHAFEFDGWKLLILPRYGDGPSWKVEARDPVWRKYSESYGETIVEALTKVQAKINVDLEELLVKANAVLI